MKGRMIHGHKIPMSKPSERVLGHLCVILRDSIDPVQPIGHESLSQRRRR